MVPPTKKENEYELAVLTLNKTNTVYVSGINVRKTDVISEVVDMPIERGRIGEYSRWISDC